LHVSDFHRRERFSYDLSIATTTQIFLHCGSLKRLEIFSCKGISRMPEMGLPSSLEELAISYCSKELSDGCMQNASNSKQQAKGPTCFSLFACLAFCGSNSFINRNGHNLCLSVQKKPKVKIHREYVKQACLITSAAVFIVLRSKVSSSVNHVLHPLVSHETS